MQGEGFEHATHGQDPDSGLYCRRCYGLVYASTCDDALSAAARRRGG